MSERAKVLADFVRSLNEDCQTTLDQIVPHEGKRGDAFGEVAHSYRNAIDGVGLALYKIEDEVPAMTGRSLDRVQRAYETVFHQLRYLQSSSGMQVMRMQAFEAKVDFAALGWQGPTPSEVLQSFAERVGQFMSANPDLASALTGKGDRPR
jgi:hypothetical protein